VTKRKSTNNTVTKKKDKQCNDQNKKTAFYNWKTNGRIKDIHDPFLLERKITTYELRKNCRKEMAQKRIQERQTITEARSSDKTLFYRIIRQQRGKLTRFIDELTTPFKLNGRSLSNPYHNSHLWSVLLVVQSVTSILLISGLLYCCV
jgi:hypothetical protein